MIVLDTNVISELMKPAPSPEVADWIGSQPPTEELYLTAITVAEVFFGIELLPKGKRRDGLFADAEATFAEDFAGRILSFDDTAARAFSEISASRRARGRPIAIFDAQIAAIALVNRAALATRNVADFAICGVRLVNPWE